MTPDDLAKIRAGEHVDETESGEQISPVLSVLADMTEQLGRIAANTEPHTFHVRAADAVKAWESTGMRMYEDKFYAALKALRIVVDE